MHLVAAGLTDVGREREHNEDNFCMLHEHQLFVVADGMGGHRAGDVASRLAVDEMKAYFQQANPRESTWPTSFDHALSIEENRLITAIQLSNRRIFEEGFRSRESSGMGTTIVSGLFCPDRGVLYIAHVGDSRAYRVRNKEISLLTRDHSLVNDYLLAMPELTQEQMQDLPRNVITRALGMQDLVAIDMLSEEIQPGDTYVFCSDGLTTMVPDEAIRDIVVQSSDVHDAARRLIQQANDNGGEDNVTALVVAVRE
jgi:serine/threonine protein phosphatase PrpC